ncbi:hypothetical protein PIROE2DRAFT_6967 [Piromyces sp. E2]|nr:hypothetical protein PIROE2DRAFT_6967 [Piromyces sp. E2]|eukprot:OUM65899.1 hypothetical protein PIROE2DRAFT_6967 [Piromyces sp. E2]
MNAHFGYKLDSNVRARSDKIVNKNCHKFCPCCKSGRPHLEHGYIKYPTFINIRQPVYEPILIQVSRNNSDTTFSNFNSVSDSDNSNFLLGGKCNNNNNNNNTRKWKEFYTPFIDGNSATSYQYYSYCYWSARLFKPYSIRVYVGPQESIKPNL